MQDSGTAAALDYRMRCINVPLASQTTDQSISNSLLPEIARLRSRSHLRDAFAPIDRTAAIIAALAATAGCAIGTLRRAASR